MTNKQPDAPTAAFILTELEDGSYVILDAAGRTHPVAGPQEVGAACCALLHDPTLPRYEMPTQESVELEKVASKVAAKVFPEFEFAVTPALQMVREGVQRFHQSTHKPKRRYRRKKKSDETPQTFAQLARRSGSAST